MILVTVQEKVTIKLHPMPMQAKASTRFNWIQWSAFCVKSLQTSPLYSSILKQVAYHTEVNMPGTPNAVMSERLGSSARGGSTGLWRKPFLGRRWSMLAAPARCRCQHMGSRVAGSRGTYLAVMRYAYSRKG